MCNVHLYFFARVGFVALLVTSSATTTTATTATTATGIASLSHELNEWCDHFRIAAGAHSAACCERCGGGQLLLLALLDLLEHGLARRQRLVVALVHVLDELEKVGILLERIGLGVGLD